MSSASVKITDNTVYMTKRNRLRHHVKFLCTTYHIQRPGRPPCRGLCLTFPSLL